MDTRDMVEKLVREGRRTGSAARVRRTWAAYRDEWLRQHGHLADGRVTTAVDARQAFELDLALAELAEGETPHGFPNANV